MKIKFFLILIIILASLIRLVELTKYPAGFNADEAALGYNAYSLLLTGRDEHGHSWPVNLESFGDFKPALYTYLLIPLVKFFGLHELVVRLPAAISGILAVAVIYFLGRELINEKFALLASFVLAVSPWHIHFSRGAWEVNLASTLLLIGVWALLKWQKTLSLKFLLTFAFTFSLSLYAYQSARIIAPLLGLGLGLLNLRQLIKKPSHLVLACLFGLLLSAPLLVSLITTDAASRFSGVGLLADEGPLNRTKELRGQHSYWNSQLSRPLHNRPVIYSLQFASNYLDHFSPGFLFISGDVIERSKIPFMGQLYLVDLIFLCLGIIYLVKKEPQPAKYIFLWLFVAPVAAALTFQTPHALRSQNMIIPLTLILASGLYYLFQVVSRFKRLSYSLLLFTVTIYLWQISYFLHMYFVHYPQIYPAAWEYGFKELVPFVNSVKDKYQQILVTDKYDQPYILFLFYSQYPPQSFQNHHELTFRDKFNFSTVRDFDKYHFAATPWEKVRDIHSSLIVAAPEDIPEAGVNVIKTIYFPNRTPAFKIISN